VTAISMLMVAMAVSLAPMADAADGYDQDLGEFYSYTVYFGFDGQETESVSWDFGDGSDTSSEWNVTHTFPAKGTYYVTQVATNPLGSSTAVYKVQIMGFPLISFDSAGGSAVANMQLSAYNITATAPSEPVKTGFTFAGWYKDSNLTTLVDWSDKITASATYHAKWIVGTGFTVSFVTGSGTTDMTVGSGETISVPADPVREGYVFGGWFRDSGCTQAFDFGTPVTSNVSVYAKWTVADGGDDDAEDNNEGIVQIAILVIGIAMILGGAYIGRYEFAIVGAIVAIAAALLFFGVVKWPF
ncbi:MAG: InlB B-repeat-containing protein, partial [Candidatus Methanomethylophilaceae archaeon]